MLGREVRIFWLVRYSCVRPITQAATMTAERGPVQEGFDALDAEERPWLLNTARKFCRGLPDAEDLAQDLVQTALVQYFQGYAREQMPPGKRRALLGTILTNRFFDECRKRKRHAEAVSGLSSEPPVAPDPPAEPSFSITLEQLEEAIQRCLSEKLRDTYLLHMKGMKNWEIARYQGITEQNVAKRIHDARKKLRKYLQRFIN
jgi:RNA polymerase sigma factor (sigma-70 family)